MKSYIAIIGFLVGIIGVSFYTSKLDDTSDLSKEIIKPSTKSTGIYLQFEVNYPRMENNTKYFDFRTEEFPSSILRRHRYHVLKAVSQDKITSVNGDLFIAEKLDLPSNMWNIISIIMEILGWIVVVIGFLLAWEYIFELFEDLNIDYFLLALFGLGVIGCGLGILGISIWSGERPGSGRYTTVYVWVDNCTDQNVTIWINDIKRAHIPSESRLFVPFEFISSNENTASIKIMDDNEVLQQITILEPTKKFAILNIGEKNSYSYRTQEYKQR